MPANRSAEEEQVASFRAVRPSDLPGIVAVWNRTFAAQPNFIPLTEADFRKRVMGEPSFDPDCFLVSANRKAVAGFVHYGPLTNFWYEPGERRVDPSGGQIWAVVAPPSDRPLLRALLEEAVGRLSAGGATRILLHPSWVQCTQPFYNGIAGGYENPGLAATRDELLEAAAGQGFAPVAEYGTPELDLSDQDHIQRLSAEAERILARFRGLRRQQRRRVVRSLFFPDRDTVELAQGGETVAVTAYSPWEEYCLAHGRRVYGITGVQVARAWRGQGLGKVIMTMAIQAARAEGAEALHLHVYRENRPAWNLYHRALGFQPRCTWLTLEKRVRGGFAPTPRR